MNFIAGLATGRVNRVGFLLLAVLIAALTVLALNTLHISSDRELLFAVLPGLIGGGFCLHALRVVDIGWRWFYALPTLLARVGWLYALSQVNFFRGDNWLVTALALFVLDLLLVIALAVWPGRRAVAAGTVVAD